MGLVVAGAVLLFGFLAFVGHASRTRSVPVIVPAIPTPTVTIPTPVTTPGSSAVPVLAAPPNAPCPARDGSSPHYTKFSTTPRQCLKSGTHYRATITTDAGRIVVDLDQTATPKTVNNFVFLAGYHYFDGIVFHRVVTDFVVQGGDPTGTGTGGPGYTFADELPPAGAYKAGSVAMANGGADTNGSQFFIVTTPQGAGQLQPNYSLFGQVTLGMDVVVAINNDGSQAGTPLVLHHLVSLRITAS